MAIADRINEMYTHVGDVYDTITNVDLPTNKNIQNIPQTIKDSYLEIMNNGIDRIWNNWEKVTGSGTSISLSPTLKAPMRNNLKGNTYQTGTPTPTNPIPVNVVSGDNTIKIEGKNLIQNEYRQGTYNNASDGRRIITKYGVYLTAGTQVALSIDMDTTTYRYLLIGTTIDGVTSSYIYSSGWKTSSSLIVTIADSGYYFVTIGYINETSSSSITPSTSPVNKLQLEKNNQATTYEPYQGNTYNIDLPVENLCNNDNILGLFLNFTNSTIGEADGSKTMYAKVPKNTELTVSRATLTNRFRIGLLNEIPQNGGTFYLAYNGDSSSDLSKTINSGNYEYVAVQYTNQGENTNIQIEKGTKANTYTPYGTTPIELCKIGNYQDYFYKDSDKWYLHKEIKKLVLNGSESFPLSKNTSPYVFTYVVDDYKYVAERIIYCNYFEGTTNGIIGTMVNGETHFRYYTDGTFGLYFCTADYSNTADFTNWVSTHNIIAYYVLSTPTNTEITDTTLINQLEELYIAKSKENQTNISQINNDLPFIISASALKKGV